ncbi:MAG: thiolase family protein [Oligoflexia bacterium]|nr:thiolase family protein [Oligoflexia bacterium]
MAVYILSGSRTPIGSFMGKLATLSAPELAATAIKSALAKAEMASDKVEEVFMGEVLTAGVGQAPARQAAIYAKIPSHVPATTINKVCGSGLKSIIMGAQTIYHGDASVVVSGGMENMSLAPHFIPGSRLGLKFGGVEIKDTMQWDGLWDVYSNRTMGECAEECVRKLSLTREEQDQFAISSFKRAQEASRNGTFKNEIAEVTISDKKGVQVIAEDEGPFKANFEKIPALKPVFEKNGTITAANASTINDGAAALVLAGENYHAQAKFKIVNFASHAEDPTWFTLAPVGAIKKCLQRANLSLGDIGVFEINEAFACVALAAMKELKLSHDNVNVYGGAIALGHPIGCSGSRIVVTLMNAMERRNVRYGMAAICIGGGEALAMVIEKL